MTPGAKFNMTGYDVVALTQTSNDDGLIVVLNNNSSHYLVVRAEAAGLDLNGIGLFTVQFNPIVELVKSFSYTDNYKPAFQQAITLLWGLS